MNSSDLSQDYSSTAPNRFHLSRNDSSALRHCSELVNDDIAQGFCHHGTEKGCSALVQHGAAPVSRHSAPPPNYSETGNHDAAQYFCHDSTRIHHHSQRDGHDPAVTQDTPLVTGHDPRRENHSPPVTRHNPRGDNRLPLCTQGVTPGWLHIAPLE